MGLTRTLCKLSYNKDVDVECSCAHGKLTINIKEAWTRRPMLSVSYDLEVDIEQQEDVTERLRKLGLHDSGIIGVCKGKCKQTKGYVFKYYEQD